MDAVPAQAAARAGSAARAGAAVRGGPNCSIQASRPVRASRNSAGDPGLLLRCAVASGDSVGKFQTGPLRSPRRRAPCAAASGDATVPPFRSSGPAPLGVTRSRVDAGAAAPGEISDPPLATRASSASAAEVAPAIGEERGGLEEIYAAQQKWQWRGHTVNYSVLDNQEGATSAVVFVHGFGASIGHWRRTMPLLARDHVVAVYALDLLGLGASDKPAGFPYSIEAWAEMVDDFAAEVVKEKNVIFVGNSIGSLVTLAAAAAASQGAAGLAGRMQGVVLMNCAGGLNNKAIQDDWRIRLALPIFNLIDFLLSIPSVARAIFNSVKTEANVRSALLSVYNNAEAVDDELVQLILRPADDEGALGVFVAVITGPPGPRPEVLVPQISCPILVLWGDKDPFTPSDGPVGKYFKQLPVSRNDVAFVELKDVGHCPQDDRPELVHDALVPWLENLLKK